MKIFIDWCHSSIFSSPSGVWKHSSLEECDLIISIDCQKKYDKNVTKILWLYEPYSISTKIGCNEGKSSYTMDYGLYDYIATHHRTSRFSKSKTIYMDPYLSSWIHINQQSIYTKSKNISMICSNKNMCQEHDYRLKTKDFLSKKINIDVYGKGFKEIQDKIIGLQNYRFSVAMENDISYGYYSEKILDCFLTGTIPIYYGSQYVYDIFDKNGIIDLKYFIENISTFDYSFEYDKRIDAIQNNFNIAKTKDKCFAYGIDFILQEIKK